MERNVPIILAIDFDETIAINSPFPNIVGLVKDAAYFIRKLYNEGYYIIINTCRSGEHARQAMDYLDANNVPFHNFNENHPALIEHYKVDSRKISADIYVDDKNLLGLPPWDEVYIHIKRKKIEYPALSFIHKKNKIEEVCQ